MCRDSELPGVRMERSDNGDCVTTLIEIVNRQGAEAIQKPIGRYITLETQGFPDSASLADGRLDALCAALEQLLPPTGDILAVGLGNTDITPDALGPECAAQIIATRHLPEETKQELGLQDLRTVSVLTPGVAGKTGIESTEIIASVVKKVKPAAVLTVDALAARSVSRLAKTVQLCDTGIQPGSGVGNSRKAVDERTLGVPVIAVGVPTVVDAGLLARELTGETEPLPEGSASMIVTPREIDVRIADMAKVIGYGLNLAFHDGIGIEDIELFLS